MKVWHDTTSTSSGAAVPQEFTLSIEGHPLEITSDIGVPPGVIVDRRITEQIRSQLPKIRDPLVVAIVQNLVRAIEEAAFALGMAGNDLSSLPPAIATVDEDGSVFIEWITRDFRLGFDVDPDFSKSGWYVVTSSRLGDLSLQGALYQINPHKLVARIVQFALANS